MYGRRGNWEMVVLLAFAAGMIYPDKIVEWFEEQTGAHFGWVGILVVEVVSSGAMFAFVQYSEKADWLLAAIALGIVLAVRVLHAFVMELFMPRD